MNKTSQTDSLPPVGIRILQPGDEVSLEAFLLPRVDSSMFLVGNMRTAGLHDRGRRFDGTYAAVSKGDEILGVVAHYWNQNLILQAPDHLAALCQAAVAASGRQVKGVLGPSDLVQTVKEALNIVESQIQMDETEILYSLLLNELVVPAQLGSGTCRARRAKPSDLELMTEWRVAFSLESLGEHDSPELWTSCRTSVERATRDGHIWVLESDGKPVATTAFNTALREVVQIGGVWTPPAYRSRGYGRSAVAASLLDARAEGAEKAILFTGESNLPAQRAYTALGFQIIGDYRILLLRSSLDWPSSSRHGPMAS